MARFSDLRVNEREENKDVELLTIYGFVGEGSNSPCNAEKRVSFGIKIT